jgi:hypothetical protein
LTLRGAESGHVGADDIIHVAQVDTTDWIKVNIFGVEVTASWWQAITNRPLVSVAIVVLAAVLVAAVWWLVTHRLPPADRRPRLAADPIPDDVARRSEQIASAAPSLRLTDPALVEKVALVSLVTIIFAEVLPGVEAGVLAVSGGVALVIVANIVLSMWLTRRLEFVGLAALNTALIWLYAVLLPAWNGSINLWHALFFGLLLTLIVTLYDRYRPIHLARFEHPR